MSSGAQKIDNLNPPLHAPRRAAYGRDGFLILRDFVSVALCRSLAARAGESLRVFGPEAHHSVFSTREQTHTSDKYVLSSGESMRGFCEADRPPGR